MRGHAPDPDTWKKRVPAKWHGQYEAVKMWATENGWLRIRQTWDGNQRFQHGKGPGRLLLVLRPQSITFIATVRVPPSLQRFVRGVYMDHIVMSARYAALTFESWTERPKDNPKAPRIRRIRMKGLTIKKLP